MSSTYAGNNSYPNAITIPSDGDDVEASAFNPGYEGLADRTAYLVGGVTSPTGVARLRFVSSIANLKAVDVTSISNGEVALVSGSGGNGGALYIYRASDSSAEASPTILQPNAGSGRWWAIWTGGRDIANGIAGLDATGKVPAAEIPMRIVGTAGYESTGALGSAILGTPFTTYTATPVTASVAGGQTGDIVMVEAHANLSAGTPGDNCSAIIRVNGVDLVGTEHDEPNGNNNVSSYSRIPMVGRTVLAAPGTVTATLFIKSAAGLGSADLHHRSALNLMVIRP